MAGNVAEWVADVYRPIVDGEYNDFNYFRGNVYTKNAINEDGTVKIITTDEIAFDTLSNGKVAIKTLPGQVANVPAGDEETYLRTNFDTSDNRNFRDGDLSSSRDFDMLNERNCSWESLLPTKCTILLFTLLLETTTETLFKKKVWILQCKNFIN